MFFVEYPHAIINQQNIIIMTVQEAIDKLEELKRICGNGNVEVYAHGQCQDKDYDAQWIGWNPLKKKVVFAIWDYQGANL